MTPYRVVLIEPDDKEEFPMKCEKCQDTGVIETGNNDLPCECPAGDKAIFNVVGGQQTGAQLKRELGIPTIEPE
jgi:hypothetical protein